MYFYGFFDVVGLRAFILLVRVIQPNPNSIADQRKIGFAISFRDLTNKNRGLSGIKDS